VVPSRGDTLVLIELDQVESGVSREDRTGRVRSIVYDEALEVSFGLCLDGCKRLHEHLGTGMRRHDHAELRIHGTSATWSVSMDAA
jgi:hypothetical protein